MPFANDLLEQAKHLANRERKKPRQASLRRAVSTAYYALFHLLIHEATLNWRRAGQRALLARFFEHGKMKAASERQRGDCTRFINSKPPPPPGQLLDCMKHLLNVADAFVQAQQQRHTADYDSSTNWSKTEVLALIAIVDGAFQSLATIKKEDVAQDYLLSLLGAPKG
ncbi:MAG: hypothetical protein JST93_05370 [Acidobacteria bacterium]|nr:hypothetical protein [Acidobacteriota bacterium]